MARNYPETIPTAYITDANLASAYRDGWNHGHGIACHNVPKVGDRISPCIDYVGIGRYVTPSNIREYHSLLCHAGADNSRCYSPFEFTAHEFNEFGEGDEDTPSADDLWKAFEAGTEAAIAADLEKYTDEDYGIDADEEEAEEEICELEYA